MRISQVQGLQYSLSYLMASSASGSEVSAAGIAPLDATVALNIEVLENPKVEIRYEGQQVESKQHKVHQIGFSVNRDKFLQLTKDMRQAVNLL